MAGGKEYSSKVQWLIDHHSEWKDIRKSDDLQFALDELIKKMKAEGAYSKHTQTAEISGTIFKMINRAEDVIKQKVLSEATR